MSIFDRFTSQKGKATPKRQSKAATVEAEKKEAFKQVPGGSKPEPKSEKKADVKTTLKDTGAAHRVLLGAIVTEKSALLETETKYVFAVASDATKKTVADAVQKVYGIRPVAINMVSLPGKWVRYGRSVGRQIKRKKAVITLPAGKKIDIVSA